MTKSILSAPRFLKEIALSTIDAIAYETAI